MEHEWRVSDAYPGGYVYLCIRCGGFINRPGCLQFPDSNLQFPDPDNDDWFSCDELIAFQVMDS